MGALSFSPSPITTTPVIDTEPSTARMASTAAWSTSSLSPKPIFREAAIAAASVTRTSSRARLRSGASRPVRACIAAPPARRARTPLAILQPGGTGIQDGERRTLVAAAPALGRARPPAVGPWRFRSHPDSAEGPLHVRGGQAVGAGHPHHHGHSPTPVAASAAGEDEGLRAVRLAAAGLAVTAAVEFAFVAASGSVALLADGLHNLGDVFTTATLWIAFLVGRRRPQRGYTLGLPRRRDRRRVGRLAGRRPARRAGADRGDRVGAGRRDRPGARPIARPGRPGGGHRGRAGRRRPRRRRGPRRPRPLGRPLPARAGPRGGRPRPAAARGARARRARPSRRLPRPARGGRRRPAPGSRRGRRPREPP